MIDDSTRMGWLESDLNIKLWRKFICPKCDHAVTVDPNNLQGNKKVECHHCGYLLSYQLGHLFPEDVGAKFPEPLPSSMTPINEDIVRFFNILIDILSNIETGKESLREVFHRIRFIYGLYDHKLDAYATSDSGKDVIYISHLLVIGMHEFFWLFGNSCYSYFRYKTRYYHIFAVFWISV